ncbi:MAG: hypothetical protein ACFFD1_06960, partial [Candidatus Thorarchaeota archaeon]
FVNDIYNIVTSLLTLIEEFSKKQSQFPTTFSKNWLNNVISQCTNSLQLISIIRTLTLLNESKIVIKRVEIKEVIEDVLDYFVQVHINKKINLTIEIPDEDIYLLADEFLFDVFINIIFSSIKYNPNPLVDFKIIIYRTLQDNANYVKIEFVDYKSEISHIQKETFLKKNIEKDSNIKELLIGFLLVEQILDNYNGKIWVEGGNFVIMIPEA